MNLLQIHPADNVAVALHPVAKGEHFQNVSVLEDIPQGHKLALRDIAQGEDIMKYGFPIGHATQEIAAGQWVHVHNVRTNLSEESEYVYRPQQTSLTEREPAHFSGYIRDDGRAAIRNEIWIIPTVGCVNGIAECLAKENQHLVCGNVEGLYAYTHIQKRN